MKLLEGTNFIDWVRLGNGEGEGEGEESGSMEDISSTALSLSCATTGLYFRPRPACLSDPSISSLSIYIPYGSRYVQQIEIEGVRDSIQCTEIAGREISEGTAMRSIMRPFVRGHMERERARGI